MSSRRFPRAILQAVCLLSVLTVPAARAADPATSDSPSGPARMSQDAAREAVLTEMAQYGTIADRLDRAVRIAFAREDVDPAVRDAAREIVLDYDPRLFLVKTMDLYEILAPAGQLALLQTYDRLYPKIEGYDFHLNAIVTRSVASPDREIRKLATDMACRYHMKESYFNLRRRANRSTGEDRIEAVQAIGKLRDRRGAYFLPTLLGSDDRAVREVAFASLGQLGREGSLPLKERLTDADQAQRILALKALLPMVTVDDLPALYAFSQANPDLDESLKSDLFERIARLEVQRDKGVETPGH